MPLIGKGQLVAQIGEPIVYGGGGEHQDLGFHPSLDDFVHQALIPGLAVLVDVIVSEVVGFIDYHKIVVSPVHPVQAHAEGLAGCARQVGVAQHVVAEAILGKDVGCQIGVIVAPVVRQLFGTKNQHILIAQLIVFDHRQGCERLPQADRIRKDTAVVGLKLVDHPNGSVALVIEQLLPDEAF